MALVSNIAPVSWLVENDVKRGRDHPNLSRWDRLNPVKRGSFLNGNRRGDREQGNAAADSIHVIEWTRAERDRLRSSESGVTK
jgi:hypothetical protein